MSWIFGGAIKSGDKNKPKKSVKMAVIPSVAAATAEDKETNDRKEIVGGETDERKGKESKEREEENSTTIPFSFSEEELSVKEDKKEKEDTIKEEGIAVDVDDTYDVLKSIEKSSIETKKMVTILVKRNKALEQRLDEYDKLFSRLTEYLDDRQMQDARQHNRLLRLGMPVPFRSTQTDRVGMDRVPSHGADRWQSVAQGPFMHRHAISTHNGQPMCNIGLHRDI